MTDLHTAALTTDAIDLLRILPDDPMEVTVILATVIAYIAANLEAQQDGSGVEFSDSLADMIDGNIDSDLFVKQVALLRGRLGEGLQ